MAEETKLISPSKLGLHLSAGAADGFLTSAHYVFDETAEQSIQKTIDELRQGGAGIADVYVNGVSVVDENKIAKITLPNVSIELTEGNLDDIISEGYYFADESDNITNKPSGVTDFGLKIQKISTGNIQQILFTPSNDVYMRTSGNSGSFGSWVKLVKDTDLANYVLESALHSVAFSGSYNDLEDKPTIDEELSLVSENTVQNKVITAALESKLDEEDVDSITTEELNEILK